jgi:hypothetical protein
MKGLNMIVIMKVILNQYLYYYSLPGISRRVVWKALSREREGMICKVTFLNYFYVVFITIPSFVILSSFLSYAS